MKILVPVFLLSLLIPLSACTVDYPAARNEVHYREGKYPMMHYYDSAPDIWYDTHHHPWRRMDDGSFARESRE